MTREKAGPMTITQLRIRLQLTCEFPAPRSGELRGVNYMSVLTDRLGLGAAEVYGSLGIDSNSE